jgi:ABC-type multidrug transport system fused ATPase/permease subunit
MITLFVRSKISMKRICEYLATEDIEGVPSNSPDDAFTFIDEAKMGKNEIGTIVLKNLVVGWRNVETTADESTSQPSYSMGCFECRRFSPTGCCFSQKASLLPAVPKIQLKNRGQKVPYQLLNSSDNDILEQDSTEVLFGIEMHGLIDEECGISIPAVSANLNTTQTIVLKNLNIVIQPKSLVAVVGPTGSGKSSFLQGALLGEGLILQGSRLAIGEISYTAQSAWIQNATLQENILFGSDYEESR